MIAVGEPWTVVALISSLRSVDFTEPGTMWKSRIW
jgi:hypothetical protein